MPGKSHIVDRIAERGWSRADAGAAVDAVLEEITAALAAGERVTLTGFGTFEPAPRAARTARNPRTGATVDVAATTVARFHPGAGLRARVGGGAAPSTSGANGAEPRRQLDGPPAARKTERRAAADRETGVPDPAEPADTTKTIHRAKGADDVSVRSAKNDATTTKAKAAEKRAAEKKASEKKASEKRAAKKAAEKKAATKAAEQKAAKKAAEKKAAKKAADKKAADKAKATSKRKASKSGKKHGKK
jgi:DNA-binding protein HU-beta